MYGNLEYMYNDLILPLIFVGGFKMYPYKIIHCDDFGCYESCEHDRTLENEIYIACDKMIHKIPVEPHKKLFRIIDSAYRDDSCNCCEAVDEVIFNCVRNSEYRHIHLIAECMHIVRGNYDLY